MSDSRVSQLGYLEIEATDLGAWARFSTDVLGLEALAQDEQGVLRLRMDEHDHRIAVRAGPRDDVVALGWQVRDEAELRAVADRLEDHGFPVEPRSEQAARARGLLGLVSTEDPDGIVVEVGHGPALVDRPFRSPRAIAGFVAGSLGLGHVALNVADREASLALYRDGLGLRVSDFIELDLGDGGTTSAAFLHCGPRHHSVAVVEVPAPTRLHHLMLELASLDDVGTTYDLCQEQELSIAMSLGRHTNDRMLSFYVRTPSGFAVEYGHGGRLVDDADWEVEVHHAASVWGHHWSPP